MTLIKDVYIEQQKAYFSMISIEEVEELGATEAEIQKALDKQNFIDYEKLRNDFILQIDRDAGLIRQKIVSPGVYVDREYELAYNEAVAWKNTSFDNNKIPLSVIYWAETSSFTEREAAEDIIKTREKFNFALLEIRRIRLKCKYELRNSHPEDVEQVYANYKRELFTILERI